MTALGHYFHSAGLFTSRRDGWHYQYIRGQADMAGVVFMGARVVAGGIHPPDPVASVMKMYATDVGARYMTKGELK